MCVCGCCCAMGLVSSSSRALSSRKLESPKYQSFEEFAASSEVAKIAADLKERGCEMKIDATKFNVRIRQQPHLYSYQLVVHPSSGDRSSQDVASATQQAYEWLLRTHETIKRDTAT